MITTTKYNIEYLRDINAYKIHSLATALCPKCGSLLTGYDTRIRKTINGFGERRSFLLRRLRCSDCNKLHLEIPEFIMPNKHYEFNLIQEALNGNIDGCSADNSTIRRWRNKNHPPGLP